MGIIRVQRRKIASIRTTKFAFPMFKFRRLGRWTLFIMQASPSVSLKGGHELAVGTCMSVSSSQPASGRVEYAHGNDSWNRNEKAAIQNPRRPLGLTRLSLFGLCGPRPCELSSRVVQLLAYYYLASFHECALPPIRAFCAILP